MSMGPDIIGTIGADSLTGTSNGERIFALDGADTINGGGGGDAIDAGAGADSVSAWGGDVVTLGGGQDTLGAYSGGGSIEIHDFTAGPGGDLIVLPPSAGGSPTFENGGALAEQVGANTQVTFREWLPFGRHLDFVVTLDNVQATSLTVDNFTAYGDTSVHTDPQAGVIRGGPGDRVLSDSAGINYVLGGDGNDTLFAQMPVGASLKGEPGNDVLVNSSILGGELDGGAGNDTLWGGSRGFMVGGEGNDVLVSQGTIGYMTGGSGADQFWLAHGFGNDEITDFNPAEGDQILVTGPVSYTAVNIPATASSAAAEKIYFADGRILALDGFTSQSLGDNWLTVVDDGTPHTIFPAAIWQQGSVVGDGSVKEIGGSAGDVLVGGTEQDAEYGNGGNDTLWGGGGLDFLYGGDGNDILTPQQGSSVLIGGAGADRFVIGAGAAGETHWITDFNAAEGDRVVLSPGVAYSIQQWSGLAAVTLSSGAVIGLQGVTAANLGDWVVYG